MTQIGFFGQEDEGQGSEPAAGTGPGVDPPADGVRHTDATSNIFVTTQELYAANAWGDLLRLVNFNGSDVCLVVGADQTRPLLWDRSTGTWYMQGRGDFQGLADTMLAYANSTALEMAEADPTVGAWIVKKLKRRCESNSGVSATHALKLVSRLAVDPTVQIPRVDVSVLNRLTARPVLLAGDAIEIVGLSDGTVLSPRDIREHYLLSMVPGPTPYIPSATNRETPGAVMMQQFLRYLGNGDGEIIARRLGWQLCGHHETLDVIAGDHGALRLLARALRDTLGPSGVHILSLDRGTIRARDIAHGMEEARLCVWPGADTRSTFPVWEINGLITDVTPFRQGNVLAFVADWPEGWDTLDHRIAATCGWAWRVQGLLSEQDIDVDTMLDQAGRECLLALLVEGARDAVVQFQASQENGGDPSQVAATDYSRACAEEMRVAGAKAAHRILYRALRCTNDPRHVMTLAEIDDAIAAIGEEPLPHNGVGKWVRRMWPQVQSDRPWIDGTQTRVIRLISPRAHADLPDS